MGHPASAQEASNQPRRTYEWREGNHPLPANESQQPYFRSPGQPHFVLYSDSRHALSSLGERPNDHEGGRQIPTAHGAHHAVSAQMSAGGHRLFPHWHPGTSVQPEQLASFSSLFSCDVPFPRSDSASRQEASGAGDTSDRLWIDKMAADSFQTHATHRTHSNSAVEQPWAEDYHQGIRGESNHAAVKRTQPLCAMTDCDGQPGMAEGSWAVKGSAPDEIWEYSSEAAAEPEDACGNDVVEWHIESMYSAMKGMADEDLEHLGDQLHAYLEHYVVLEESSGREEILRSVLSRVREIQRERHPSRGDAETNGSLCGLKKIVGNLPSPVNGRQVEVESDKEEGELDDDESDEIEEVAESPTDVSLEADQLGDAEAELYEQAGGEEFFESGNFGAQKQAALVAISVDNSVTADAVMGRQLDYCGSTDSSEMEHREWKRRKIEPSSLSRTDLPTFGETQRELDGVQSVGAGDSLYLGGELVTAADGHQETSSSIQLLRCMFGVSATDLLPPTLDGVSSDFVAEMIDVTSAALTVTCLQPLSEQSNSALASAVEVVAEAFDSCLLRETRLCASVVEPLQARVSKLADLVELGCQLLDEVAIRVFARDFVFRLAAASFISRVVRLFAHVASTIKHGRAKGESVADGVALSGSKGRIEPRDVGASASLDSVLEQSCSLLSVLTSDPEVTVRVAALESLSNFVAIPSIDVESLMSTAAQRPTPFAFSEGDRAPDERRPTDEAALIRPNSLEAVRPEVNVLQFRHHCKNLDNHTSAPFDVARCSPHFVQYPGWLLRVFDDPSPSVRSQLLLFLVHLFKTHKDSNKLRYNLYIPVLDVLGDDSPQVFAFGCRLLVLFSRATPLQELSARRLIVGLKDARPAMRRICVGALGASQYASSRVVKAVIKGLQSGVADVSTGEADSDVLFRAANRVGRHHPQFLTAVLEDVYLRQARGFGRASLSSKCPEHLVLAVLLFGGCQSHPNLVDALPLSLIRLFPVVQLTFPTLFSKKLSIKLDLFNSVDIPKQPRSCAAASEAEPQLATSRHSVGTLRRPYSYRSVVEALAEFDSCTSTQTEFERDDSAAEMVLCSQFSAEVVGEAEHELGYDAADSRAVVRRSGRLMTRIARGSPVSRGSATLRKWREDWIAQRAHETSQADGVVEDADLEQSEVDMEPELESFGRVKDEMLLEFYSVGVRCEGGCGRRRTDVLATAADQPQEGEEEGEIISV